MGFLRYTVFLLLVATVAAQEAPPGMDAAAQLRFGVGARALGMGSAFTAIAEGPAGIYWNPAALVGTPFSFGGTYTEPFGGAGELGYRIQFLGAVGSAESLGFGVGWFNSHVSDIPWTDGGGSFDYDSSVYFLSLALAEQREGFALAVGGSVKVYRDVMLEGSALGFGYDLGLLLDLGDLRIAYCSQDVGNTRYRWKGTGQEPLVFVPWVHRFGVTASFFEGLIRPAADLVVEPGEPLPFLWRVGIEIVPVAWMALRGGVRLDPFGERYHPVFTLGLGLAPWEGLALDYAFLLNPLPAAGISTSTHVFSVRLRF